MLCDSKKQKVPILYEAEFYQSYISYYHIQGNILNANVRFIQPIFQCAFTQIKQKFSILSLLQAIYSRVARVCKNDRGGLHKFAHKWTTFLKARLNCSVPGDFPFSFNEIQGTTKFVRDGKDQIIYATFTTPDNALAGSAICSFRLSDIKKAFDEGHFKGQSNR